ncbi:beta-glucosidase family protein [Prauserella rugosa]|uniref:Exo-alpha-(1->6)-L-arabinopyranosidase n=1 Tax=Prauserella rugosa TaxID=43354 RepID=A0A660CBD7_9PSEU|nr:glycoside hydrolase family 3 N-terminal domain-containing protein [Prauserella rugosa]KMS65937.1 beta-glucosidase [Streptomyces regensis]TWH20868.1 beta-glucosidase [Prauserella rugosa]
MHPWRDPTRSADERVKELMAAMTLREKIAQLGAAWIGADTGGDVAPMQDVFAGGTDEQASLQHGIGHLTRVFGTEPVTAAEGRRILAERQRHLIENTRLGVPAIAHEECLTGFTTFGASVYPTSLAWAATFDPELIEEMAAAIGRDMAAVGVHQGLSPVLDVVRDYRWGRVEETMGEDPYLVGAVGTAYVRGLQSAGVVATLKHFAGYSASRGARNHAPVSIGPRELADVILPPFEMALREGGAGSVMNSYTDVDGVPVGSDETLLTGVLRDEWGFDGVVVSDYWSVSFLETMHRVAENPPQAGSLALAAGIDVELPDTRCYGDALHELVRDGRVAEELVDRSVRRVLRQKLELGLLDDGWSPEPPDAEQHRTDEIALDSDTNRSLARRVAERSVVLLANDSGALPLASDVGSIAVIGPCADDPRTFLGCYSYPNHVLPRYPDLGLGIEVPSLVESMRRELPDVSIGHEQGCAITGQDRSGFAAATAAAQEADLAVLVVGDRAGMFGGGTSGEGCDAPDLELPGVQAELAEAVQAVGTPVVLVVVSGRPYALGGAASRSAAVVQAFMPGEEGGAAIAGVLSGRITPAGKLPVQIPADAGAQPNTYLHPPLGGSSEGISNLDTTPLFPFGHGLSYTEFAYDELTVSAETVPTDGEVEIACSVRNAGDRTGTEIVQLYLDDPVAQVARPVTQLVGFTPVRLEPGQTKRVTFRLHADRTSYTGRSGDRIVEPGEIRLMVGASSADVRLRCSIQLTGDTRRVGIDRRLSTPARVA